MEKQIKIIIKGGILQHITTNFDCVYQIIDYDEKDFVGDILEPDLILLDQNIFVDD